MEDNKIKALAEFLGVEEGEIEVSSYDEDIFEYGSEEYLILTDEEADQKTKEYILDRRKTKIYKRSV